jgi:hypothetical protein
MRSKKKKKKCIKTHVKKKKKKNFKLNDLIKMNVMPNLIIRISEIKMDGAKD